MQCFVPRRHKLELLQSRSEQARCIYVTPLRVRTQQLLPQFKTSIMFIITMEVIFGTTQSIFKRNAVHEHISNFDGAQGKTSGGHHFEMNDLLCCLFLTNGVDTKPVDYWRLNTGVETSAHINTSVCVELQPSVKLHLLKVHLF